MSTTPFQRFNRSHCVGFASSVADEKHPEGLAPDAVRDVVQGKKVPVTAGGVAPIGRGGGRRDAHLVGH